VKSRKSTTFDTLPDEEKGRIRAALRALSRADSYLQAYDIALAAPHDSAGWSAKERASYEFQLEEWGEPLRESQRHEWDERREQLAQLARTGSLPLATLQKLKATFETGIVVTPVVNLHGGHPEISLPFKFITPEAAVAFAFLRLAQLSTRARPAVLLCAECKEFRVIESTGGRRSSGYCGDACRYRFNTRKRNARLRQQYRRHK